MKSQETEQFVSTGKEGKAMSAVDAFSPEQARNYAQRLFQLRVKGWGDETDTLEECARMTRMTPLSFKRLMAGKTKSPSLGMFGQVRKAYLDYCAVKAAELLTIIEKEKEVNGNVRIGDMDQEVASLVARIEAPRSIKMKGEKGR